MFSLVLKFHTLNTSQKDTYGIIWTQSKKKKIAGDYNFKYYLIWIQYFDRFMYCKHIKNFERQSLNQYLLKKYQNKKYGKENKGSISNDQSKFRLKTIVC